METLQITNSLQMYKLFVNLYLDLPVCQRFERSDWRAGIFVGA